MKREINIIEDIGKGLKLEELIQKGDNKNGRRICDENEKDREQE